MEGSRMTNLIRDMKDEVWAQRRTPYVVPSGSKRWTAPTRRQPSYQPASTPNYQYSPMSFASPYTNASEARVSFPEPQLSVPNLPVRQGSSVMTQPGSSSQSPLYVPLDLGNQNTSGSSPPRFPIPELDAPANSLPQVQSPSVRYGNVSPFMPPQYSNDTSYESCHSSWSYSGSSTSSVCLSVYGTLLSRAIDEMRQCKSIFSVWKFAVRRYNAKSKKRLELRIISLIEELDALAESLLKTSLSILHALGSSSSPSHSLPTRERSGRRLRRKEKPINLTKELASLTRRTYVMHSNLDILKWNIKLARSEPEEERRSTFKQVFGLLLDPSASVTNWLVCGCFKPRVYIPDVPRYNQPTQHRSSRDSTHGSKPKVEDCSLFHILQPGLSRRLRAASESLTGFQIYIDKFRQQFDEPRS